MHDVLRTRHFTKDKLDNSTRLYLISTRIHTTPLGSVQWRIRVAGVPLHNARRTSKIECGTFQDQPFFVFSIINIFYVFPVRFSKGRNQKG